MIVEEGQTYGSVVLHHKIADGGMGSVWAANDSALGHPVAVKFLSTEQWMDPEGAERFAIEARMAMKIESPYVPRVYRTGTCSDGTPFMVMELVRGEELTTWLAEQGPILDAAQVGRLLDQVAGGLTAAHKVGVVHRDVKSENILVSGERDDFEAKLIDFGIAKSTRLSLPSPSLTRAGSIVGTPIYMSPEQLFSSKDVDERSDVWSLAVVAYRCLTGQFPFDSETFAGLCVAIQSAHVTPVTELRPELPVELDRWFDKALARDPRDRFESAETMSKMFRVATSRPSNWTKPVRIPVVTAAMASMDAVFDGVSHTTRRAQRALPLRMQGKMSAYIGGGSAVGLCVGFLLVASPWKTGHAHEVARVEMTPVTSHATLTSVVAPAPVPVLSVAKVDKPAEPIVRHSPVRLEEHPAAVARVVLAPRAPASPASPASPPSISFSSVTFAAASSPAPAPTVPPATSSAKAVLHADVPASSAVSTASAGADAGVTTPSVSSAEPPASDPHNWKPTDELGEP